MTPGRRALAAWFGAALVVRAALAWPQSQPGYMDAAYYFAIADSLAAGRGLNENFAWNYLTHPAALPQPSNAYWMPLASFIVAPFLWLPIDGYRAAQIPMIVLSAALVPLAWHVSLRLFGRRDWAVLSAVLMLASSFYTPFWTAIDSFALYALIGVALILLVEHCITARAVMPLFGAGLLAGLAHLTRADGFLWLVPATAIAGLGTRSLRGPTAIVAGYLLVMTPWFARNIGAFGTPLPGGALYVRTYDELFFYETALTLDRLLAQGWQPIAAQIGRALLLNAATVAGALHIVFLPFALIALWRHRAHAAARMTGAYLLTLYAVLSIALSGVSWRGTMLHSLAAVLPLLYVYAPPGLSYGVEWAAKRRRWNGSQAERVFSIALAALAIALSVVFYTSNVNGNGDPAWNEREAYYRDVSGYLSREAEAPGPVMTISPPTYWYFARSASIALPSDSVDAVLRAAAQFGARYIVLQPDHPKPLAALYAAPAADPRFRLVETFHDSTGNAVYLLRIQ